MNIIYQNQEKFYNHFLDLIIELECGTHYDKTNCQHIKWLKSRINTIYMSGGEAICLYDDNKPVGFILVVHDKGLVNVSCFGKKANIAMFGLFSEYRSKGIGKELIAEAEKYAKNNGAECIYVDTYARNTGAIRFYTKCGYTPVAYHPGENGKDDKGQVYLYKELID